MSMINSLTAIASGEVTNTNSLIFYTVYEKASRKMTGTQLQDVGLGQLGAMKTLASSTAYGVPSGTSVVSFPDTEYDFDAWVDANSVSLLRVPNGLWSHVELGCHVRANRADIGQVWITKNGASAIGLPRTSQGDLASEWAETIHSAPIAVSSGDYFEVNVNFTNAATLLSHEVDFPFFYIRPIRRTP